MTARPWVPGWWGTARLRLDVFEQLEDMPRKELAQALGVSVSTLRRYENGEVCPPSRSIWADAPLDKLASVVGCRSVDLLEFRPLEDDQRPRSTSPTPCPAWCTDHELLAVHSRGLPGEVDVLSNRHKRCTAHGRYSATLTQLGYVDYPNVYLDIDGPLGQLRWKGWPADLPSLKERTNQMSALIAEVVALDD